MKIDDAQLRSICEAEIRSATGYSDGELASERAIAMNRYLGQPRGDEVDGRSQVVTREILDAVEWLKPSLMRIFASADNIVEFEPVGPEDEEAAKDFFLAMIHDGAEKLWDRELSKVWCPKTPPSPTASSSS